MKVLSDKHNHIGQFPLRRNFRKVCFPISILEQKAAVRIAERQYSFGPIHIPRQLGYESLKRLAVDRSGEIIGVGHDMIVRVVMVMLVIMRVVMVMLMVLLVIIMRVMTALAVMISV